MIQSLQTASDCLVAASAAYDSLQTDRDALAAQLAAVQAQQYAMFSPVVYAHLEDRTDWSRGADRAGLDGNVTIVHNDDGSTTFTFSPVSSYNNDYNFVNLETGTRNARASKYVQITEFEISEAAMVASEQVETNFEHTLDNYQYNGGISFLFGSDKMRDPVTGLVTSTVKSHVWRWFDITPGRNGWYELPDVPVDMTMFGTGKRVRIVSEFARVDNTMVHQAVTINGTRYPINRVSTAKPQPTWGPHIQHGFQLDTRAAIVPYSVKVWDMECRVL